VYQALAGEPDTDEIEATGVIYGHSRTEVGDIFDGSSSTLMVGETDIRSCSPILFSV